VFSRGAFSLVGLLAAITVFAFVITLALGKLVGQSTADRDLALQVAAARNGGTATGTSGLGGTVKLLTTGAPLSAVSVSVFDASDTTKPLLTTATDSSGAYSVNQLAAGKYKLSFKRAGFVALWYPAATTDADATTVELKAGEQKHGLDVGLGGLPASITGTVTGDDVSAALLYLETVPGRTNAGTTTTNANDSAALPATPGTTGTGTGATTPAAPNPLAGGSAIVQKVPVGADGTFALTNVPSPNVYQLVVVKTGYATTVQELDVAGGEQRTGVELTLRRGDGLISGVVSATSGPLPNVTITATSGQSSVTTVSLTEAGKVGTFMLRGLPTPGSFTLTATSADHAPQTLSLTLAAGQKLTGVQITLNTTSGTLQGMVTELATHKAALGVNVTATDGQLTVQSQTQSRGQLGHWSIGGLPVPGTYTLTFARSDLISQTVSVALDANGNPSGGPIQVAMQSATTSLTGVVTQGCGALASCAHTPVGEATVTLNSGSKSYTVTTASYPTSDLGRYVIDGLPPGTYTLTVSIGSGVSTYSQVITLQTGTNPPANVSLNLPASVTGVLKATDAKGNITGPLSGWKVFLYTTAQYPSMVSAVQTTDSTGRFTFSAIDAGDYLIAIGQTDDPASTLKTVQFTVQPSQAADLQTVTVQR
jgi:hypothetical protein